MAYYSAFLALHLISLIIWLCSLLVIYRLIVLQTKQACSMQLEEAFYMYKLFASPALSIAIILGTALLFLNKGILSTGFWIYIKFFLISMMIILHHQGKIYLQQIKNNTFEKSTYFISYHSYMPMVLVAIVAFLTITKLF